MPFIPGPARVRLPHHNAPAWATEILTFEEAERHLRRLTRISGCGCMRYGGFTARPTTRVQLADGITRETPVARLMATMSADLPLGPDDFACHRCDVEMCANPDHIRVGSFGSNMRDRSLPGRPIRERMAARFFDTILEQIPVEPARPPVFVRKIGRPLGYNPLSERSAMSKTLSPFVVSFERDQARKVDADAFPAPCTSKPLPPFVPSFEKGTSSARSTASAQLYG